MVDNKSNAAEMYRAVFNNTEQGCWVLRDILKRGGVESQLWAKDQLVQNAQVARHDFAIEIKELTKEQV